MSSEVRKASSVIRHAVKGQHDQMKMVKSIFKKNKWQKLNEEKLK